MSVKRTLPAFLEDIPVKTKIPAGTTDNWIRIAEWLKDEPDLLQLRLAIKEEYLSPVPRLQVFQRLMNVFTRKRKEAEMNELLQGIQITTSMSKTKKKKVAPKAKTKKKKVTPTAKKKLRPARGLKKASIKKSA